MRWRCALVALALLPGAVAAREEKPDLKKLTEQVLALLKADCSRCHGADGSKEGGMDFVLDLNKLIAKGKVVPGDLKKSRLYRRVSEGDMPPEDEKPRPSDADIALLKAWIEALGKEKPAVVEEAHPEEPTRAFVSTADNLRAIRDHLQGTPRNARRYQNYFTFTNLHNDPHLSARDLALRQAALSKLLNSLSRKKAVVLPHPVDAARTVWVVDIRKLDWDKDDLWHKVLAVYPYGLKHDHLPADEAVNTIAKEIHTLSGTHLPAVRADWFLATASRPPLYHDLLRLPETALDLEKDLGVDVAANFLRGELARAGFTESGVSAHNRLVERHEGTFGAYWKSYDFRSSEGKGNLFVYPLGPAFKGNPYPAKAFEHAGGEIIFQLPNGLQGYMLVDGKDRRIDEGPTAVVRDKTETAGTVAVVNGLSCMSCHAQGMIREVKDGVRRGTTLRGEALVKVHELYPPATEMDRLLLKDRERFLRALDRSTGLFLKVGADRDRDVKDQPEVIGAAARAYRLKEVDSATAALELGLKDRATLERAIKDSRELGRIGLLPLAQGRTIKREVWESLDALVSPYQVTARVLGLGTPQRER